MEGHIIAKVGEGESQDTWTVPNILRVARTEGKFNWNAFGGVRIYWAVCSLPILFSRMRSSVAYLSILVVIDEKGGDTVDCKRPRFRQMDTFMIDELDYVRDMFASEICC